MNIELNQPAHCSISIDHGYGRWQAAWRVSLVAALVGVALALLLVAHRLAALQSGCL